MLDNPQRNKRLGRCEELPFKKNLPVVKPIGADSLTHSLESSTLVGQLNQRRYKN